MDSPLVICYIAMENDPFTDDCPIKSSMGSLMNDFPLQRLMTGGYFMEGIGFTQGQALRTFIRFTQGRQTIAKLTHV